MTISASRPCLSWILSSVLLDHVETFSKSPIHDRMRGRRRGLLIAEENAGGGKAAALPRCFALRRSPPMSRPFVGLCAGVCPLEQGRQRLTPIRRCRHGCRHLAGPLEDTPWRDHHHSYSTSRIGHGGLVERAAAPRSGAFLRPRRNLGVIAAPPRDAACQREIRASRN